MTFWSRVLTRSHDKLKTLCFLHLYYQNVNWHQTWQVSDLPWVVLTIKLYDPFITWSYKLTWQTTTLPKATKLLMVDYIKQIPVIKLFSSLVTWSGNINLQSKAIISKLPQYLCLPYLGASIDVVTCLFNHVVFWDQMKN